MNSMGPCVIFCLDETKDGKGSNICITSRSKLYNDSYNVRLGMVKRVTGEKPPDKSPTVKS